MAADATDHLVVRQLGCCVPYEDTWHAMKAFTESREVDTPDEIWLLEHHPVYTQGQAGKAEHLLSSGDIPVIKSDRGGQITYHGPGQLIAYLLIDLRRRNLGVKKLVYLIEQALIDLLASYSIGAERKEKAPGVYVSGQKIASLGLRVRKNCTYHGLSLNVDMDLAPFQRINVCGYRGLQVTQLNDFIASISVADVSKGIVEHLAQGLGYQTVEYLRES